MSGRGARPDRVGAAAALLAVLIATQFLVPGHVLRYIAYTLTAGSAAYLVRDGERRHRPAQATGWRRLEVGLWLHTCVGLLMLARALAPQAGEYLATAQTLTDTFSHLTFLAAAAAFLAARRPGHDRDGLIDAATVILAAVLLAVQWSERHPGVLSEAKRFGNLAVAVLMAAALIVGLRLYLTKGRRPSFLLLVLGATLALTGNAVMAVLGGPSTAFSPRWVESLWLCGAGLAGLAAQVPGMRELSEPEPARDRDVSAYRFVGLGAALVVNPALVVLVGEQGTNHALALAAGVSLLTLLVLWRIGRLALERERMRQDLAVEVAERETLQQRLQHQATHDLLTGLPNRSTFLKRLEEGGSGRRRDAVLFLDLDGFKPVNDTFGHHVGDELLTAVAARLSSCLRSGDLAARLGGDEFASLVDTTADDRAATSVAERIVGALSRPFALSVGQVSVGASVGIAYPGDSAAPTTAAPTTAAPTTATAGTATAPTTATAGTAASGGRGRPEPESIALLRRADAAMYAAKRAGKGRYAVWPAPASGQAGTLQRLPRDTPRIIDVQDGSGSERALTPRQRGEASPAG